MAARSGRSSQNEPSIALNLLRGLLATAPGIDVAIDMPDAGANPNTDELIETLGLVEVFRTARMYTKGAPALPLAEIYATTTLELG